MKIKLNTDVVLAENYFTGNYINKLKALVHYHRMEQIRPLDAVMMGNGNAYCEQFQCTFIQAEFEVSNQ